MTELKGHAIYLSEYLHKQEKIDVCIKIFLAVTSSASIAGWVIWKDMGFIWAFLIAGSQAVNAVKPFLPFEKRIQPLRSLSFAFDELSLDAEQGWHKIAEGSLTEDEINDALFKLKRSKQKIWKKLTNEISIPHDASLHISASKIAEDYFTLHYQ